MADIKVNGMFLSQINDLSLLTKLVSSCQDFELRKAIRARLQQVKSGERAPLAANMTTTVKTSSSTKSVSPAPQVASGKQQVVEHHQRSVEEIGDSREQMIKQRQRDAAESKARTLQMYDNMAKSGAAGDHRPLDINAYRGKESGKLLLSGAALQKTDLVEETIRERVRASEENKKRLLAAYDYAAKTQPAGTVRDVDFELLKGVDVSGFEPDKPAGSATFRMSNGVPSVAKPNSSVPSTPVIDLKKAPSFTQEQPHLDAYERALRQRKQEADERKKRTLAAYDAIARSGVAGPKIVVREELEHMESGNDDGQVSIGNIDFGDGLGAGVPKPAKTSPIKGRPTNAKDALLHWCYMKTRNYDNVYIKDFSSSWADGLAFCALLHHFFPDEIDYASLNSDSRRHNFDLAFKVAEQKAKVFPLLETDDMIKMGDHKSIDWRSLYTYVAALYTGLKPFDPTQK